MRNSGILMHISSLPSKYGIGTLGKEAYSFIDFLKKSGQTYWQILPVNPTSYGDSPYQSPSAFAGNPYLIDLDILIEKGLLTEHEINNYFFGADETKIDYYLLFQNRYPLLRTAFQRFKKNSDFEKFSEENKFWLEDFAFFMALKEENHYCSQIYWDNKLKMRDKSTLENAKTQLFDKIEFYKFLQFEFFEQWALLKQYANKNGIQIIGDMPIYVALDSADVWSMPEQFLLNKEYLPLKVSGCPPDAFSEKGQLWGNPLYNWEKMKEDGFTWWIERMRTMLKLYDRIRIDHFRGFESYYAIEYGKKDAIDGNWEKGPGIQLFEKLKNTLGNINIIAEDLGYLTPEVYDLLSACGYPGMKVLQFAFDPYGNSSYLPHNHIQNCVLYTGTHDNDTTKGWYSSLSGEEKKFIDAYIGIKSNDDMPYRLICTALASVAETTIIPIQDYLELGSEARMNTPSTLGKNWIYRISKKDLSAELSERIANLTKTYRR